MAGGNVGQVVRYLHDPDSYKVIAPSFDHYLQQLIDENYAFVFEDEDY
ncbi:SMI1/KNR4 family protein [Pseudomonas viridiflava]|nr:SMI1/KNR4 family protein [Pseudomonas viridiflava]